KKYLNPGAIVAKHGGFTASFDDADNQHAVLSDHDGLADAIRRKTEPLLCLGVDETDGPCVFFIDQGKGSPRDDGAVFNFVPGRLDPRDVGIGLRRAVIADGVLPAAQIVLAREVGNRGTVLEKPVKVLRPEADSLPGDHSVARPPPVGRDEYLIC